MLYMNIDTFMDQKLSKNSRKVFKAINTDFLNNVNIIVCNYVCEQKNKEHFEICKARELLRTTSYCGRPLQN